MTLQEIKQAVNNGVMVHWKNDLFVVEKLNGDYYIVHTTGYMVDLASADGLAINGKEHEFYTER